MSFPMLDCEGLADIMQKLADNEWDSPADVGEIDWEKVPKVQKMFFLQMGQIMPHSVLKQFQADLVDLLKDACTVDTTTKQGSRRFAGKKYQITSKLARGNGLNAEDQWVAAQTVCEAVVSLAFSTRLG